MAEGSSCPYWFRLVRLRVMEIWGFAYKSDLLTWIKMTTTGKVAFGTGYTTRRNTEMMIYGTRGHGLQVLDHSKY